MRFNSLPLAVLALLSLSSYASSASAQKNQTPSFCRANPVENKHVKGRAFTVNRADGKQITIVGHLHGERQINDIAESIVSGDFAELTNDELINFFKELHTYNSYPYSTLNTRSSKYARAAWFQNSYIVDVKKFAFLDSGNEMESRNVIEHARGDFSFLEELLEKNPPPLSGNRISYIASEAIEKDESDTIKGSRIVYDKVLTELNNRNISGLESSSTLVIEGMMSSMMGHRFLQVIRPEIFLGILNVGVEDKGAAEMQKASGDVWGALDEKASALEEALAEMLRSKYESRSIKDEKLYRQFFEEPAIRKLTELFAKVHFLNSNVQLNVLGATDRLEHTFIELIGQAPTSLKPLMREFTKAAKIKYLTDLKRDKMAVKTLAGNEFSAGNTVHFVGLGHLAQRVRLLENDCTEKTAAKSLDKIHK